MRSIGENRLEPGGSIGTGESVITRDHSPDCPANPIVVCGHILIMAALEVCAQNPPKNCGRGKIFWFLHYPSIIHWSVYECLASLPSARTRETLPQASLLTACSSFRNALFLALHFLMLTNAKARLMVLTEACGATSLGNSDKGRRRAFLDSLTRRRSVLVSIILCLPGMGRFFTSPLFWNQL